MAGEDFDPDQAARISAAIVKAIAEAKVLVDAENIGPELHDVVQHARELHDLLREQVDAAPPMLLNDCAACAMRWGTTSAGLKNC
jgi:hypothetical protein